MITELRLRNFKAFKDTGVIPLSRLNIFVGANSSGKSSVLQSLLLLKQSLETRSASGSLALAGEFADVGSFREIIHKHNTELPLQMELTVRQKSPLHISSAEELSRVRVEFKFGGVPRRIRISRFVSSRHPFNESIQLRSTSGTRYTMKYSDNSERKTVSVRWTGFLPHIRYSPTDKRMRDIFRLLHEPCYMIGEALGGITYVGPLRRQIERFHPFTGEVAESVGPKGEHLFPILVSVSQDQLGSMLIPNLNKWLGKKLDIARKVDLVPVAAKEAIFSLTGLDSKMGIKINLAYTGSGVSQVVPLIVEGFLDGHQTIIAEQPELHLHPRAQVELGDFFIEVSKKKQVIVETHSEHIILRVRRRIAEGLDPADVAIFFVERKRTGSAIRQITFGKNRLVENWPSGFFDEDYEESLEIALAHGRKKGNK